MYQGKNGVPVEDVGECWRAHGSANVLSPQIYDYVGHDERPTGVRYAMGFDSSANATRIAFVDYPKDKYSLEEVIDSDDTPSILMRCNVCSAMDQAAQRNTSRSRPYESVPQQAASQQIRVSAGELAPVLPKYMTFAVQLVKGLALRPVGNVAVSLGLAFLADLASGFVTDPRYKQAIQSFGDGQIDDLDPELIERVKQDAIDIAEAAMKDGDNILSRKQLVSSMFKTRGDLKKEISASKKSPVSGSSFSFPSSDGGINIVSSQTGLIPPRLFE